MFHVCRYVFFKLKLSMLEHFLYCCSPDSVSYWCSYFNYRKSRVCAFASLGAIAAAGSRCCVRLGAFVQGAAVICVLSKGSDVRPGVAWSPQLCRCDSRGRRGTWCSPRGRMYMVRALMPSTHTYVIHHLRTRPPFRCTRTSHIHTHAGTMRQTISCQPTTTTP